jgi:hypothetical protein
MSNDSKEKQDIDNLTVKKKKFRYTLFSTILVLILFAALVGAWFYYQLDMGTLLAIKEPSDISILGPDGAEMSSIDLNYTEGEKTGDQVTVKRVFCVQTSADKHRLEIAHTTNLKGLTFNIYKVSDNGTETVTDEGRTYRYDKTAIAGSYLNLDKTDSDYKYANHIYHGKNYEGIENGQVQIHAEPVYWLANQPLDTNKTNSIKNGKTYRTYYVCEVSWTETTKETDIFYILAKIAK